MLSDQDAHTTAYEYADADTNANINAYSVSNSNSHRYAYADRYVAANEYAHTNSNAVSRNGYTSDCNTRQFGSELPKSQYY